MKEEKLIQNLLDQAKSETPQLSFETVAKRFEATAPTTLIEITKSWIMNNIYLNTLLILTTAGIFIFTNTVDQMESSQEITQVMKSIQSEVPIIISPSDSETIAITPDTEVIENPVISLSSNTTSGIGIAKTEESAPLATPKDDSAIEVDASNSLPAELDEDRNISISIPDTKEEADIGKGPIYTDQRLATIPDINFDNPNLEIKSYGQTIDTQVYASGSINEGLAHQNSDLATAAEKRQVQLLLKRSDDAVAAKKFERALRAAGLQVKMQTEFIQGNQLMDQFSIRLKHDKGLKYRLKGKGFDRFEMKLYFDQNDQLQYFLYSFNEKKFSGKVPLNCTGRIIEVFGEGHSSSSSSISIEEQ